MLGMCCMWGRWRKSLSKDREGAPLQIGKTFSIKGKYKSALGDGQSILLLTLDFSILETGKYCHLLVYTI
jgi:hypothetical protein